MSDYHVLDLFAGLGGFSQAFAESPRWGVTTVEIDPEFDPDVVADVFELRPSDFDQEFDVIVGSPPCQFLNTAGNHDKWDFERKQPTEPESREAVALFHHTIGLIHGLAPEYWFVENPRASRIRWTFGAPDATVTYCQYGTEYQKPTGLWGEHPPMTYRSCSAGEDCHVSNTETDGSEAINSMNDISRAERSKVPYDLSKSIRDACEAALDGDALVQTTADEWVTT